MVLLNHAHHMVAGGREVIVRGTQSPLVIGGQGRFASPRRAPSW
jgi:hypothetical protein